MDSKYSFVAVHIMCVCHFGRKALLMNIDFTNVVFLFNSLRPPGDIPPRDCCMPPLNVSSQPRPLQMCQFIQTTLFSDATTSPQNKYKYVLQALHGGSRRQHRRKYCTGSRAIQACNTTGKPLISGSGCCGDSV